MDELLKFMNEWIKKCNNFKYEKIKNSNPDFDSIEEIQFILSNNHCEIFYAKKENR